MNGIGKQIKSRVLGLAMFGTGVRHQCSAPVPVCHCFYQKFHRRIENDGFDFKKSQSMTEEDQNLFQKSKTKNFNEDIYKVL